MGWATGEWDSVLIRDSKWGGQGTQLAYQAIEMVAAAEAGAALHEDVPLHS